MHLNSAFSFLCFNSQNIKTCDDIGFDKFRLLGFKGMAFLRVIKLWRGFGKNYWAIEFPLAGNQKNGGMK